MLLASVHYLVVGALPISFKRGSKPVYIRGLHR